MPSDPEEPSEALDRARRAAAIIDLAHEGVCGGDIAELSAASEAFDEIEALSLLERRPRALMRTIVCGSVKLAAIGRQLGQIELVRRANVVLSRLASHRASDPLPRRAFAENSVDLMLAEARENRVDDAIGTYLGIAALADSFDKDQDLACARAKAAANLVALALEADREGVADQAMGDLRALRAAFPGEASVHHQLARGQFNRLAWSARSGSPQAVMMQLEAMAQAALDDPGNDELVDLASDAAFVLVTRLGTRRHHQAAMAAYRTLAGLATLPAADGVVRGRLAEAAFNLVTDLCETGRQDEAQLIYDDLSGLSVADDDNPTIRLAQAKAAANLALTLGSEGDAVAAELLADDLRAMLHAHPDDLAVFEVASFLDGLEARPTTAS